MANRYRRNYMYPLSDAELRAFRSFFHSKYGASLFYVTDTFIQSAYLEFSDVTDSHDDGTCNAQTNIVMDVVAQAEDFHASLHQQRALTKEIAARLVPCAECKTTGTSFRTGFVCQKCGGTGKRPKRQRES